MSGRHDKAGGDEEESSWLLTGPIVVRGISRGVLGAFRSGQQSRHRAGGGQSGPERDDAAQRAGVGAKQDRSEAGAAAGDTAQVVDDEEGPDVQEPEDRKQHAAEGAEPLPPLASEWTERAAPAGGDPRSIVQRAQVLLKPLPGGGSAEDLDRAPEESSPSEEASPAEEVADAGPVGVPIAAHDVAAAAALGRRPGRGTSDRSRRDSVAVAVLVVLVLVCAGLVTAVVLKTRGDAAVAAREAAAYTPPVLPLAAPSPSATGPVLVLVGDEALIRAASGVTEAQRWTSLVGDALEVRVIALASTGAGYANGGADDADFAAAAARIPGSAKVVVFVGGGADASTPALGLAQAATTAFSVASQRAPGATVVAVGPLFRSSSTSVAQSTDLRRSIQNAARIAGVDWVDPIRSGWVSGAGTASDLTVADEQEIATRMRTLLQPLLD